VRLRITASDFATLFAGVFAPAPEEGGAFLMCRPFGSDLVVRRVRLFAEGELNRDMPGLELTDDAKVHLLVEAKRAGDAVVDVHTHPFATHQVDFSPLDLSELPAFARYVQLKLPNRPFGALVLGTEASSGIVWAAGRRETLALNIVGQSSALASWPLQSNPRVKIDAKKFDRQVRALGVDAQSRLQNLQVGVVGLGGIGSLVIQQLAHLGVSHFVLVEDDYVEASNLPRLAGANRKDAKARTPKVSVAERVIRQLAERPQISAPGSLRTARSIAQLQTADVIVGCVDNDGARLILAELASAGLIPYLDIGVSIEEQVRATMLAGGRSSFYLPGEACLACADEIDFQEAAEDLESEAVRSIRIQRGYARDRRVESALMPLNSSLVGQAMMEFLAYISGFRRVVPFFRYDASQQRIVSQRVNRQADCPVCGLAHAAGDAQAVSRYAILTRS
jgi:molybdopterin/thiamine biosynthesis adenylyltransferase